MLYRVVQAYQCFSCTRSALPMNGVINAATPASGNTSMRRTNIELHFLSVVYVFIIQKRKLRKKWEKP